MGTAPNSANDASNETLLELVDVEAEVLECALLTHYIGREGKHGQFIRSHALIFVNQKTDSCLPGDGSEANRNHFNFGATDCEKKNSLRVT